MGKLENTGIDLTLNTKNIVKDHFNWSSTLVFSRNKNKIKEVYGNGQEDLGNRWFIGQPVGVIYDFTKVGIWQEDEIASGANKGWDDAAQAGDLKLADLGKAAAPSRINKDMARQLAAEVYLRMGMRDAAPSFTR